MAIPCNTLLTDTVNNYFDNLPAGPYSAPNIIEEDLLQRINVMIDGDNAVRDKDNKLKKFQKLPPQVISDCMLRCYHIQKIDFPEEETQKLGIYITEGPLAGTYSTNEKIFRKMARQFNRGLLNREFAEIMTCLEDNAESAERCINPDLIPVGNGIFDYKNKKLLPFSPNYVFLSKLPVNYNGNVQKVILHNSEDGSNWDVESWIKELSDDPEIVNLIWELLGAIIRPHVCWNKSAWFVSDKGNNGKGTLCEFMRNLCGSGNYVSIKMADFDKDFSLSKLPKVFAIITDENDVGTYLDKCANLKAIITGDGVQINRKYYDPFDYHFKGMMIQCLNDLPKIRDRTDSFYRRCLFIPFDKCFTGQERTYIKADYINRQEVLEYVLHKVLNMNYYTLSTPKACIASLDEYKEFNDPMREFVNEILPQCQWDLLPNQFLYDLYKSWFKMNVPCGSVVGRNTFLRELKRVLPEDWMLTQHDTGTLMSRPEPLIEAYDLDAWYGNRSSIDPQKKLVPNKVCVKYRGIIRKTVLAASESNDVGGNDNFDS